MSSHSTQKIMDQQCIPNILIFYVTYCIFYMKTEFVFLIDVCILFKFAVQIDQFNTLKLIEWWLPWLPFIFNVLHSYIFYLLHLAFQRIKRVHTTLLDCIRYKHFRESSCSGNITNQAVPPSRPRPNWSQICRVEASGWYFHLWIVPLLLSCDDVFMILNHK